MNRGTNGKNIKVSKNKWQYNWQFVTFISKCRFKVFKNPKTQKIVATAFQETEIQYKIRIKEFSFGEDYAHVHMEIDIPNKYSVSRIVQALKSHSSSKVFQEMPNYKLRYSRGSFWGGQYSNGSVSPRLEETVINYIRLQDVSVVSA